MTEQPARWLPAFDGKTKLASFMEAGNFGKVLPAPTDVVLANEGVVQPDLLFVARERLGIIDPAGGVHGAPDLVIEVLSPSTASRDQVVKRQLYGRYGVREYWIVDPVANSIEVLTQCQAGLDTGRVFPGYHFLWMIALLNEYRKGRPPDGERPFFG